MDEEPASDILRHLAKYKIQQDSQHHLYRVQGDGAVSRRIGLARDHDGYSHYGKQSYNAREIFSTAIVLACISNKNMKSMHINYWLVLVHSFHATRLQSEHGKCTVKLLIIFSVQFSCDIRLTKHEKRVTKLQVVFCEQVSYNFYWHVVSFLKNVISCNKLF